MLNVSTIAAHAAHHLETIRNFVGNETNRVVELARPYLESNSIVPTSWLYDKEVSQKVLDNVLIVATTAGLLVTILLCSRCCLRQRPMKTKVQ